VSSVFKSSVGVEPWSVSTDLLHQTQPLILRSRLSPLQISSMRTWRWGRTGKATRRLGLPQMRCSRPWVFACGTEGTDASLQRWGLFLSDLIHLCVDFIALKNTFFFGWWICCGWHESLQPAQQLFISLPAHCCWSYVLINLLEKFRNLSVWWWISDEGRFGD